MNLFILDQDAAVCARYHTDRHVSRMILDCAQLLTTAHVVLDGRNVATRRVPFVERTERADEACSRWVRECSGNYLWTADLMNHLIQQFALRHGKHNELARFAGEYAQSHPYNMPQSERGEFPNAVPLNYRIRGQVIESYRNWYYDTFQHMAVWTMVGAPDWWKLRRGDAKKVAS